jgi:hypothetical protein
VLFFVAGLRAFGGTIDFVFRCQQNYGRTLEISTDKRKFE